MSPSEVQLSSKVSRFRLDEAAGPGAIGELLGHGPGTGIPARRRIRRTWYDTFDRRLAAKGLTLEGTEAAGQCRLVLTDDTDRALSEAWGGGDPGLADSLPVGPLRDRLAPLLEERVLLALAEVTSREETIPILDAQDKTVARVVVEQRRTVRPRRQLLPVTVTVRPLRGYGREASSIVRLLEADSRFTASPDSPVSEILEAVGVAPPPTLDLILDAELPAGSAVRAVLVRLLEIFDANLDGTARDLDTEFLHDLRVSVRRARSVVKLLGDVLDDGVRSELAVELKWMGDLTTPTRDLDVYLSDLGGHQGSADSLAPFRTALQARRIQAQADLARGLRSRRTARLRRAWRDLGGVTSGGEAAEAPLGRVAAERTAKAHRRVIRDGRRIAPDSPPGALHDLRKRCKELRYLLEVFASLHQRETHKAVVGELKRLQDCLGQYQDGQVQSEGLGHFAAELMSDGSVPAQTILAMGGLAAELDGKQADARLRFRSVFERFDDPVNRRRLTDMLEAARR